MTEQNNNEEIKEKRRLFAETSVSSNATNFALNPVKYTANEVLKLLEDPQKNASSLQEVSLIVVYIID